MEFRGKVILITGAAGTIGKAVAKLFAERGALLSLVDVNEEGLFRTRNELGLSEEGCLLIEADVTDEIQVERYTDLTVERYGRIDVFFNNAGITGNRRQITELDISAWQKVMDVDVKGVLLGMKYVLRQMRDQGDGVVVNTASQAGVFNQVGGSDYCVAKGAVIHLTKIAAVEMGKYGVRVNCVMPGVVDSDMIRKNQPQAVDPKEKEKPMAEAFPLGRLAKPSEIASAVCFLASSEALYINGAEIRVDGGSSIK